MQHDPDARRVVIPFRQTPECDGVDDRPGFPRREHVRSTAWYDEYKRPLVACRLVVNSVEELRVDMEADDYADGIWFVRDRGVIQIGWDKIEIRVREVDVALEVSDEVVGHQRLRIGKGIRWESTAPWKE